MVSCKNDYEEKARGFHVNGYNCSDSLFNTFKDDYSLNGNIPKPRSVEGLCGAVIVTEKILKELGKEEYLDDYKKVFLNKFGYLKCIDLLKNGRKCNDYVGFSARYISDHLE